jgi:hypothetical protein
MTSEIDDDDFSSKHFPKLDDIDIQFKVEETTNTKRPSFKINGFEKALNNNEMAFEKSPLLDNSP